MLRKEILKLKNIIMKLSCFFVFLLVSFSVFMPLAEAQEVQQNVYIDASTLTSKSILFLSPRTATILEGSTIEVSVFVNTLGKSINTVALSVNFDPTKMIIVRPSNANSIIGIFIDPPTFSNVKGTMKLSGVIPNGITTESGLITTMTFKAITTGQATISISSDSKILANDGQGTEVQTQFDRGSYVILPQSPEGPRVFSETHPFQNIWYNNNSPQVAWDKDPGVTSFSYALDNKPFTVPDNNTEVTDTVTSYQNLSDGMWYFHIKAKKQGIWGSTTHFVIRVDTAPPAGFKPRVQFLTSSSTVSAFVSFFTTDVLSGFDHYEVGVVGYDKISSGELPVFQQVDSPYQFSMQSPEGARVVVRAFDKAGNSLDESADIVPPSDKITFLKKNYIIILLLLILLFDFLFGHRIIPHLRRLFKVVRKEEKKIEEEEKKVIDEIENKEEIVRYENYTNITNGNENKKTNIISMPIISETQENYQIENKEMARTEPVVETKNENIIYPQNIPEKKENIEIKNEVIAKTDVAQNIQKDTPDDIIGIPEIKIT